jgi:hypothetical protein
VPYPVFERREGRRDGVARRISSVVPSSPSM